HPEGRKRRLEQIAREGVQARDRERLDLFWNRPRTRCARGRSCVTWLVEKVPVHQAASLSVPAACIWRAASSVFLSNIVIVIGPTPPGTGEIAAATSETSWKATSPTSR